MNFDTYNYSQQLKKDLEVFQRWQVLIEALSEANQTAEILDITKKYWLLTFIDQKLCV
jgi:hypothetical protein